MITKSAFHQVRTQLAASIVAGSLTGILFVYIGHTPLLRALGMAFSIGGITLLLQRFGTGLGIIGGLALAFSPAFWMQTGGQETQLTVLVSLAFLICLFAVGYLIWTNRFPEKALVFAILLAGVLVVGIIGSPRSLRVTTLLSSALLLVLTDLLLVSNPHPNTPSQPIFPARHLPILMVIILIGVLNDPLFVLLAPAAVVGLHLSRKPIPRWYGLTLIAVLAWGVYGMVVQYIASGWWLASAETVEAAGIRVPYIIADGWREASRWLYLINLVRNQFTDIGILLGLIGLARLSRWHPELGTTTLLAYASYSFFGLVYFGKDSTILLLPLLMIHVIWMTYAIYALGHWLQKSLTAQTDAKWLATAAFTMLPILLLGRITGVL